MKVMVCGTNYGATYLRALSLGQSNLKPVAIMSTGSARSTQLAQNMNLQHYTKPEQVPLGSVDIACVAVPGDAGMQLALSLLSQGIHVLCEHPIGVTQMAQALNVARQHDRIFQVNAHFADLPAPQQFYNAMMVARQQSQCLHYELAVNLRTLYSGLDLLGRALGSLEDITIQGPLKSPGNPQLFATMQLSAPGVNITLLCQNFASPADDGSATLLNHRFGATFVHGNLLLSETAGPVLWFPSPVSLPPDQWRACLPVEMNSPDQVQLQQQRDEANLMVLNRMTAKTQGEHAPMEQQPNYLLALATLWENVLAKLNELNEANT